MRIAFCDDQKAIIKELDQLVRKFIVSDINIFYLLFGYPLVK